MTKQTLIYINYNTKIVDLIRAEFLCVRDSPRSWHRSLRTFTARLCLV